MDWIEQVNSVLCAFYPGQEDGNAIADVLFGDINPSARLPLTFPKSMKDFPLNTTIQYPGIDKETNYTERLEVGYRWFDSNNIEPLFPFGHGLSYSSFNYSNLIISGTSGQLDIAFVLTNTGSMAGADIPQIYIGYPSSAGEPPKNLKGFQKIILQPKESSKVSFSLTQQAFSIWNVALHNWQVVKGQFWVGVGTSSRDIRLEQFINL